MMEMSKLTQSPPTVCNNLYLVHDFVDIDAAGVGKLAIVTVSAGIQQNSVVLYVRKVR